MNQPAQSLPAGRWCWLINSAHYDRTKALYPDELKELRRKVRKKKSPFRSPTWMVLDRLVRPTVTHFGTCVCYLLVQNRSPYLQDLSIELLERYAQPYTPDSVRRHIFQVSRALNALGLIKRHLPGQGRNRQCLSVGGEWISQERFSWCDRWRKHATCRAPGTVYYPLLKVGRWLKVVHPEVSSPAEWTYELAGEFVAVVTDMRIGDWSDQITRDRIEHQVGQPMLPNSKIGILRGVRTFFRDCQEWGWIPVRFNPARALRAPRALQSLIGPAPRVIDKEYLGHKELSSTQHYMKVDPTKLASRVAKAGYLEQNMATIEVLLDQEAVMNGAASRGEVWKYYDLGHGFCTNPFWASCVHRMACARCPFYRPKTDSVGQLVEGKANLVRMLEFVRLTEDEKLLVTEGIELHQALIEKLVDVPTPAGPTPRELATQQYGERKVIPIKNVQHARRKQHEP